MTYGEIHARAARSEELPPFASLPDRLCWEWLSALKGKYERGELDEKRLRRFKQETRLAHAEYTEAFERYMAVYREYSDHCRENGRAVQAILAGLEAAEPDWRALFLLAADCLGRTLHDETTARLLRERGKGHDGTGEENADQQREDGLGDAAGGV